MCVSGFEAAVYGPPGQSPPPILMTARGWGPRMIRRPEVGPCAMEVVVIGPSTRLGQNFNPGTSNNHYPAASQPAIGYPGHDRPVIQAAPPAAGGGRSQNPPPPRREPTPSGDVCRLLSLLADKTR